MISPGTIRLIRSRFLDDCVDGQVDPVIFCMAGIPGAGKSTFVNQALTIGDFPGHAFILDPDRVMDALPEYQTDLETSGPVAAWQKWEIPARLLAYSMFEEASKRRMHIIKDMGCARLENFKKLKSLKEAGYRLHMFYIACDVDEAIHRCAQRSRYTPPELIRERDKSLRDLLPAYQKLADRFLELNPEKLSKAA